MIKRSYNLTPLWYWSDTPWFTENNPTLTKRETQIMSSAVLRAVAEYNEAWTHDLPLVKDAAAYRLSIENKLCDGIDALIAIGDTDGAAMAAESLKASRNIALTYNDARARARDTMKKIVLSTLGDSKYKSVARSMMEMFEDRINHQE